MEILNGGYTVRHNGITMTKPTWMGDYYWFKYEAPRVGKYYGGIDGHLYGADYEQPLEGTDERGEGCDGGACAI